MDDMPILPAMVKEWNTRATPPSAMLDELEVLEEECRNVDSGWHPMYRNAALRFASDLAAIIEKYRKV